MTIKKQLKVAAIVAACLIASLGLIKFFKIRAAIAQYANFQPPPETVTTYTTNTAQWKSQISAVATLTAKQGAVLAAEMSGQVVAINFEAGQLVKANDILITLNAAAEKAQLNGAKASLKLAEAEYKRAQNLRERNANSLADLDIATAKLAEAQATVINLEQIIKKKTVTAPYDGTVGIRTINVGEYVTEGQLLVPLFSELGYYADFTLPQRFLSEVKIGTSVIASVDGLSATFTGQIAAINPNIDPNTRNFSLRASLDNNTNQLKAGMFIKILIEGSHLQNVIPVPATSISYAPYGNSVWVVKPAVTDQTSREIEQKFVKTGNQRGDQIAIESGLTPGQEIVSSGTFKLRPDSKVVVNNQVQPSNEIDPNLPNS